MVEIIDFFNSNIREVFGLFTETTGIVLGLVIIIVYHNLFREMFQFRVNTAGKRNNLADMMKGIAIHGVVIIHIDSYFRYFHVLDSVTILTQFLANASRFAVPWFIISSGIFLHWKNSSSYWKAKLIHLVVPFVLICIVAYPVKFRLTDGWIMDLFIRILNGTVFTPYYFVPLLMQFYILYAFVFRKLNKDKIVLYIGLSFLINLISNHFLERIIGSGPLAASLFTNYIFYFILGIAISAFYKNMDELDKIKTKYPGFLKGIFFLVFLYLATVAHGTWHFGYEMSNHMLFYPAATFIGISVLLAGRQNRWLEYTGKNSLGIFLLHPFVIHMMHSFDPYLLGGPWVSWVVTLVFNVVIPLLIWRGVSFILAYLLPE